MRIFGVYRSALHSLSVTHTCAVRIRTSLVSLLVLALLASYAVAQDALDVPHRPAPRFFIVTDLGVDGIELTEVDSADDGMIMFTVYRPRFGDIEVYDADGNLLGIDAFRSRVGVGSVVLVAADENPVDPVYSSIIRDDAFILVGVVVRLETE